MGTQSGPGSHVAGAQLMDAEFITFGPIALDIRELERSIKFWRDVVGLHAVDMSDGTAALGVGGEPLVVLHRAATQPAQPGYAGLYHFAINLPTEPELARTLARLRTSGVRFGATDHIVAKSLYVSDPDGIGLELTFETPDRMRSARWDEGEPAPIVIDAQGRKRKGLEPLDLQELLAHLPGGDVMTALPATTRVGHLHLQVGDLDRSYRFYRDGLGLVPKLYAPWASYGDLGVSGHFAHRIAVNTWRGAGLPPRPAAVAGMRSFTVRLRGDTALQDAVGRIANADARDQGYLVRDPDNNAMVLEASR